MSVVSVWQGHSADNTPVDISGVPGTGKTATVHAVVRELKRMAEQSVGLHTTPLDL